MQKTNLKKLIRSAKNRKQRRLIIFFLVKLGFDKINVSEKITKATRIVTMMTGNPDFTTPSPTLTSITTLIEDLQTAESAMDGSKIKTDDRDSALDALTTALQKLQGYVASVAGNDSGMILSSGFEVRNPNTKAVILPAPIGLTAVNTQIEGQVKLKWISSPGSKLLYVIQQSPDNPVMPENWELVAQSSKATVTIDDLLPGNRFKFRVAVINAAGVSGWSEVAVCRPN